MDQAGLNREWRERSQLWIKEIRAGKSSHRAGLLDAYMLEACGNVAGLNILDCGCGEGRFSRMLAEQGATFVLGLDRSVPMIEAAKELQSANDEYRVADVQDLSFITEPSFAQLGGPDDYAFLRPTQSEFVLQQFGSIQVYSGGKIAAQWAALPFS